MLRFSAHIGYMFTEVPFATRMELARHNGFDAVEHPCPYDIDAAQFGAKLAELDLRVAQIGLHPGDATRGEKGFAAIPQSRDRFRASVLQGLDYAAAIGCKAVHAMAGLVAPSERSAGVWDTYIDNLQYACDAARSYDICILVEAIGSGTVANYYLDQAKSALTAIEDCGRGNIGLLYDFYHAATEGLEPLDFFSAHVDVIRHIHIADFPGRNEPGQGSLDFEAIFHAIARSPYDGSVGCEYIPKATTIAGLSWLAEYRSAQSRPA